MFNVTFSGWSKSAIFRKNRYLWWKHLISRHEYLTTLDEGRCDSQMAKLYFSGWKEVLCSLPMVKFPSFLLELLIYCHTLSFTVLHYLGLSFTILDCHSLSYTVIHCLTLSFTVLHCHSLSYTVIHCLTLSWTVLHCLTLSWIVIHCLTL